MGTMPLGAYCGLLGLIRVYKGVVAPLGWLLGHMGVYGVKAWGLCVLNVGSCVLLAS